MQQFTSTTFTCFLCVFASVLWDITKKKKFTVNKKSRISDFRGQNRNQEIKLKNQQHMFTVTFTPCLLHLASCFHPHIWCRLWWCIVGRTFLRVSFIWSLMINSIGFQLTTTLSCVELHNLFIYFYCQYFDMIS